jgi:hypothetical protein
MNSKENFISEVSKIICLDHSRTDFVKYTFDALQYMLNTRKLNDFGNFDCCLIGGRGTGKTCFLKSIQTVSNNFFGHERIVTMYNKHTDSNNLLSLISDSFGIKPDINAIESYLVSNDKILFLVLDDINESSINSFSVYFRQIIQFSLSKSIFCVLTCNKNLCRLIGKLNDTSTAENELTINFLTQSLSRYTNHWIYPFHFKKDFENLVDFIENKNKLADKNNNLQSIYNEVYLKTFGNPKLVNIYLITKCCFLSQNNVSLFKFGNKESGYYKILNAIYQAKEYDDNNDNIDIYNLTNHVDFKSFLGFLENEFDDKLIFDLIDSGDIFLKKDDDGNKYIGFISPLTYTLVSDNHDKIEEYRNFLIS